jgi:CrcB protein
MIRTILIVGMGGFVGSVLRFLVARYVQVNVAGEFPWGTLVVNVVGSMVIGLIFGLVERGDLVSAQWRIFLAVGICGGFTTFSTFANDALMLLQEKDFLRFATYAGLSFFLGILAVLLGRWLVLVLRT